MPGEEAQQITRAAADIEMIAMQPVGDGVLRRLEHGAMGQWRA